MSEMDQNIASVDIDKLVATMRSDETLVETILLLEAFNAMREALTGVKSPPPRN